MSKIKTVEAGCPKCSGTGFHGDHPVPAQNPFCPDCAGRGKTVAQETDTAKCAECNGRGHVERVPCPGCCHTGRLVIQGRDGSPSRPPEESTDVQAALITGLQKDVADYKAKIESLTAENALLLEANDKLKKSRNRPAKASDILAGVAGTTTGGDAGTTGAPPPSNIIILNPNS
jgi:hypothetical protein